jgi:hypothetical protein
MKPVLLASLALVGCAAHAGPPRVVDAAARTPGAPIVSSYAGPTPAGEAYYLVDRRAGVCWFATVWRVDYLQGGGGGPSLAPVDCCKLRALPELAGALAFLGPASCS